MRTALLLAGLLLASALVVAPAASADLDVGVTVGGHSVNYSGPINCPLVFIVAPNPTFSGGGWGGNCALYVHP